MTFVDKARTMAYLSVPVFFAGVLFLLWPVRSGSGPITQKLGAMIDGVNGSVTRINKTLDTVNAPCTGFHGSSTCGPLAQLSQTEKDFGIVAGQTAAQVRQTGVLLTAPADNVNLMGTHLSDAVDKIGGTASSATATLDAGRSYFVATQPKFDTFFDHVDGLTVQGNTSLATFNALLLRPAWGTILDKSALIATSGAGIMDTTDQVEKKLASCTLHPTFACHAKADTMFGAQVGGYLLGALPK